jgi:hypothetical protein
MIPFLAVALGVLAVGVLIALLPSFPLWLLLLLGIVVLTGGAIALRWHLIRGKVRWRGQYQLDGETVYVTLHYGSKLPKLLKHQGTFPGKGAVCFRGFPKNLPLIIVGVPAVSPLLVAHELAHDVDRRQRGCWGFWSRAWWMILTKKYQDREFEQWANQRAPEILAGTMAGVDATALLAEIP